MAVGDRPTPGLPAPLSLGSHEMDGRPDPCLLCPSPGWGGRRGRVGVDLPSRLGWEAWRRLQQPLSRGPAIFSPRPPPLVRAEPSRAVPGTYHFEGALTVATAAATGSAVGPQPWPILLQQRRTGRGGALRKGLWEDVWDGELYRARQGVRTGSSGNRGGGWGGGSSPHPHVGKPALPSCIWLLLFQSCTRASLVVRAKTALSKDIQPHLPLRGLVLTVAGWGPPSPSSTPAQLTSSAWPGPSLAGSPSTSHSLPFVT